MTKPLHSNPLMAERCDGYCASDECVCPDPTKSAAYQRLQKSIDSWKSIIEKVYGGVRDGKMPEGDSGQLLAIADWMDDIDNAADVILAGRHTVDRSMQESLRRIAEYNDRLREALHDMAETHHNLMGHEGTTAKCATSMCARNRAAIEEKHDR